MRDWGQRQAIAADWEPPHAQCRLDFLENPLAVVPRHRCAEVVDWVIVLAEEKHVGKVSGMDTGVVKTAPPRIRAMPKVAGGVF